MYINVSDIPAFIYLLMKLDEALMKFWDDQKKW